MRSFTTADIIVSLPAERSDRREAPGADLGIWEGGVQHLEGDDHCYRPRSGKRRMRAPTSAVPISDFLASKMVKVKPATVGKLGIFL
jgi:hypothetical protein